VTCLCGLSFCVPDIFYQHPKPRTEGVCGGELSKNQEQVFSSLKLHLWTEAEVTRPRSLFTATPKCKSAQSNLNFWHVNLKGRDGSEEVSVAWQIILKWNWKKLIWKLWSWLIWLKAETIDMLFWRIINIRAFSSIIWAAIIFHERLSLK
jgi:hypothetical protein